MTEDGQCFDEMNRNVWQASACLACHVLSAEAPLQIWRRILTRHHMPCLAGHIQRDHEQSSGVNEPACCILTSLAQAMPSAC